MLRRLALFTSLFLLVATTLRAADPPLQTLRLSDGAEMAYVDRGKGESALIFIHCGNCRMDIWTETLDAFSGEHHVVAMDLPGYGHSPAAPRRSFTIGGYGADVAELVNHLKLRRVVLIGNSLGGPVALEAAKRIGKERVAGIVAVDTLQNVEFKWPEEGFRKQLEAYRSDFKAGCNDLMLRLLPKDAPAPVRERIDRDTCDGDANAAIGLYETLFQYDQAAAMREAGVPVRAINSKLFPTATEINRKYAPSFDVVLMDGVGHYPQVENPPEFQRILREIVRSLFAMSHEVQGAPAQP